MERMKTNVALKYMNTKEAIYNRLPNRPVLRMPTLPSASGIKESIASKMPSLPSIPNVGQYLPDVPSVPKIPLPEPLDRIRMSVN